MMSPLFANASPKVPEEAAGTTEPPNWIILEVRELRLALVSCSSDGRSRWCWTWLQRQIQ